ncbi:MAG: substrate-binding domain-containing protein [Candidatus Rokubacteria bacterium]|nr:substrate-binding domain-containing protein [Candidatus Rokubacteria bacterium]MBI3107298.1 substrate-binding domain-containing protein [Candidatus Rokubacteria bacterium]
MVGAGLLGLGLLWPGSAQAQGPIKIGLVQGISGPFEVYAKQVITGFKLGLEHATGGKLELLGRKIELLIEDDQLKPDVAKQKVTKLYADDKVDLVVGTTSSAAALAVLPVAAEFKKVLIVEPAVADSITGEHWNRYIFRTGRNSGQDAIANALAVAKPGVSIATIAQDYAFGKDGVAAYKAAVEKLGAKVVHEEYAPIQATDFTASIQKIIGALKDKPGAKYVFVIWAGKGGPFPQLVANRLDKYGITLASGSNVLDVLKAMKAMGLEGMVGGAYYYHELPKNPMNDWLVKEHQTRFKQPPDFFTCGGFAAAMAAVTAIRKAGGTDTEKLIAAMEGMEFNTPKGKMIFRKEDHQALQSMYAFKFVSKPDVPWLVPSLLKELSPQETAPPILNKR